MFLCWLIFGAFVAWFIEITQDCGKTLRHPLFDDFVVHQAELLAGYVPRYFAELPALDGAHARIWARHGFPHHAAEAAAVQAAERCLEAGGVGGSLRRLLADQAEDLRRALAVRSAA